MIYLPFIKSCVMEIRPNTLVANMPSMSASEICPTCSIPKTYPALLTSRDVKSTVVQKSLKLTQNINLTEITRHFVPKTSDLGLIRYI